MKEVLFIIFSDKHQQYFKIIYIADNIIQFNFITE